MWINFLSVICLSIIHLTFADKNNFIKYITWFNLSCIMEIKHSFVICILFKLHAWKFYCYFQIMTINIIDCIFLQPAGTANRLSTFHGLHRWQISLWLYDASTEARHETGQKKCHFCLLWRPTYIALTVTYFSLWIDQSMSVCVKKSLEQAIQVVL